MPPDLPVFAAPFRLNGNGEVTGLQWMHESGLLTTPIALTNTHSVGAVLRGPRRGGSRRRPEYLEPPGRGRDLGRRPQRCQRVPRLGRSTRQQRLDSASTGPVAEGNVGGGTGMICHGFKGGIGTASRLTGESTVGVLVQANHGSRRRLTIGGVAVGRILGPERVPPPATPRHARRRRVDRRRRRHGRAPASHQCRALALRSMLGVGRTGGAGESSSGDFALAFSTAPTRQLDPVPNENLDPLVLRRHRRDRGGDHQLPPRGRHDDGPRRSDRPCPGARPAEGGDEPLASAGRACPTR